VEFDREIDEFPVRMMFARVGVAEGREELEEGTSEWVVFTKVVFKEVVLAEKKAASLVVVVVVVVLT
jgi:hypothetical protein